MQEDRTDVAEADESGGGGDGRATYRIISPVETAGISDEKR